MIVITEPVALEDVVADRREIDLSGVAVDNVGIERVEWSTNLGKTGPAIGSGKWTALNIPLGDGVTTITMTAIDTSGNRSNKFLRVRYDPVAVDANTPPSIAGRAISAATAGERWEFSPQASDPDGDSLWFTLQNAPAWVNFDPQTGALWGTPQRTDAGRTEDIIVSVTDGIASATLPPFSLTVTGGSEYSAEIELTPPTQRVNGSALTNLAGHRIYYGPNRNTLDRVLEVDNPGITVLRIDDLSSGSWFFSAVAYDARGRESERSATVRIRL
jgi:hypothetical protein